MKIFPAITAAFLIVAPSVWAQSDPVTLAGDAAQQLADATIALQEARGSHNRIAALTNTIKAYEQGLDAIREEIRRATIKEQDLEFDLKSQRDEIARLLAVLQTMQASSGPIQFLHPNGPLGTARAGMIVSEMMPILTTRANALKFKVEDLAVLRGLQQNSASILINGLRDVQDARTELALAISDRTDLPRKYTSNVDRLTTLINNAETLDAFATGLTTTPEEGEVDVGLPSFAMAKGHLHLPVSGIVLRKFKEPDAANIARPGIILTTRPFALVTTPWPATIRYAGPLLNYGNVMILEPSNGYLLVLAGLDQVYGEIGEILPKDSPVGLMGGNSSQNDEFSSLSKFGGGIPRSQSLYIELRNGQKPIDPTQWFALNKE